MACGTSLAARVSSAARSAAHVRASGPLPPDHLFERRRLLCVFGLVAQDGTAAVIVNPLAVWAWRARPNVGPSNAIAAYQWRY